MSTGASGDSSLPSAHLIGGDSQGWALDVDLRMTRQALAGVARLVDSPFDASVVHSVNAEMLVSDPRVMAKLIPGRKIIAQFTSEPSRLFEDFPRLFEACRDWTCVAQSGEAYDALSGIGLPDVRRIPYIAELKSFFPVGRDDEQLARLRAELRIPEGKYLIGSFVRDSLGSDLNAFKPQKGADIFFAIVLGVAERIGRDKLHVLLAGPRRHWLRKHLDAAGISYTFDGVITDGDDNPRNILPLTRLNLLINLIDLYVIPSRWEGAPAGLFHVIACKKKIISTDIAAPRDVLAPRARFKGVAEAIGLVVDDFRNDSLASLVQSNHQKVMQGHSPDALRPFWREIYASLNLTPSSNVSFAGLRRVEYDLKHKVLWKPSVVLRKLRKHARRRSGRRGLAWGDAFGASGPLKALVAVLAARGLKLEPADGPAPFTGGVVQVAGGRNLLWIPGKVASLGSPDFAKGDAVLAFPGLDAWRKSWQSGWKPARAMILKPAADPRFFYPPAARAPLKARNARVAHYSSGGEAASLLLPENCEVIRVRAESTDADQAERLRACDLAVITGGDQEELSAARALACGLPVVYPAGSPCASVVGFGGEPFAAAEGIPAAVARMLEHYASYAACAYVRPAAASAEPVLEALEI